ncbi:hypothetical protein [Pseudovibrio sp. POLY-S9]|uniref:hypothetical protein n=1 Tax=Pseudovibrio sp. POLY-S9 TaxID=1576596 RepID=UPI00070EB403|nr:hypothetical protein [Pseudovibrio sp. POLY-S9]
MRDLENVKSNITITKNPEAPIVFTAASLQGASKFLQEKCPPMRYEEYALSGKYADVEKAGLVPVEVLDIGGFDTLSSSISLLLKEVAIKSWTAEQRAQTAANIALAVAERLKLLTVTVNIRMAGIDYPGPLD